MRKIKKMSENSAFARCGRVGFRLAISIIVLYILLGEVFAARESNTRGTDCEIYQGAWILEDSVNGDKEITLPYDAQADDQIVLRTQLDQVKLHNTWLRFWDTGVDLEVFIEGDKIYEYNTKDTRLLGKKSPFVYVFVPMEQEYEGKELKIVFHSSMMCINQVYIGERYALVHGVTKEKNFEIMGSFVLFLLGFICAVISWSLQIIRRKHNNMRYISIAVMLTAGWIAVNSSVRQFLVPNVSTARDLAYIFVAAIPMAVALYFNDLQNGRYNRILYGMVLLGTLNFAYQGITYVLGDSEECGLAYLMVYTNVCIVMTVIAILMTIIWDAKNGKLRSYASETVGMVIFSGSGILQLVMFVNNKDHWYNGIIFEVGANICLAIAFVKTINQLIAMDVEKNEAMRANDAKSTFLANMSHEIRTPINAVLGMNEMILREEKDPQIQEYANNIQNAGKSLLSLINDILDFSKIDSGKMDIVPVEYHAVDLMKATYQMILARANDKGLKVEYKNAPDIPKTLYGDEVRIRQIMVNFLTNAVKYTDKGGVVMEMSCESLDEERTMLKISVSDTGKGITVEDKEKLFHAFQRVDEAKNRNIEGTGLGLHITQELVRLMDGRVEVESEYGKGSTFTVWIPQKIVDKEPMGVVDMEHSKVSAGKVYTPKLVAPGAKILMVDDAPMNVAVFKGLLKKSKMEIDTAGSGKACIALAKKKKYHMIFLDHMMPEMDGVETLELMKRDSENLNQDTPIIMLTANAIMGAKEEYLAMGFSDYLSKPMNSQQLEEMIAQYLPDGMCEM